jgi:hypothetical protein
MTDDEAFLRGVPKFLRRPVEPEPENPIFMAVLDRAAPVPPPADIPVALQAPAEAPARRPGALLPPRPTPLPEVVSLSPHPTHPIPSGSPAPAEDFFAEAHKNIHAGIADLFAATERDSADEEDDAAFQVTLPRSVIRQIRILAAQEGTTQRAIVLKALRLAGLSVPEGADIDRRILAGRRRQQA